jgi:hypothetical protein
MLLMFTPGILTHPRAVGPALAYAIVYAIFVGMVGLVAGFILRLTALGMLMLVARQP